MITLLSELLKENLITQEQLQDAKDKQAGAKKPIQELLIEMGFLSEEDLVKVSAKVFNMPIVKLDTGTVDPSGTKLLPFELAKRYNVFPIRKENNILVLAMSNPSDIIALDNIKLAAGLEIKPVLCAKSQITQCIETYYHLDDSIYDLLKNIVDDTKIELIREGASGRESLDVEALKVDRSPVVRLVNLMLGDAIKTRATDIHIEPQENFVNIRYRVDGYLKNVMKVPTDLYLRLASRIKILAMLDISETRKPQDGRIKILVNDRKVDLRISVIPTFYGEKIAIRILDPKEAKVELNSLGFQPDELDKFVTCIKKPQGIILVTGPTGSGKTSTLYAALNFIKSETKNIITIEDPIEYLIEGINQMQINAIKEVTFANSLKSILRQDPNVIFVGEIRDRETADIAFRASLTGHLVFSTLHTNNSISSVPRLMDIGLEPYIIASSLVMVVAQRLVRLICQSCKEEYIPSSQLMERFKVSINNAKIIKFYRGKGCEQCDFTGFFGRTAIFEILEVNDAIKGLISNKAPENEIFQEAKKKGFITLSESAVKKVAAGLTTLEEIANVTDVTTQEMISEMGGEFRSNAKILIVDDEEDILTVVEKRLRDAGFGVVKARDGKEAVECASRENPDLIVMDVTMPKMNGFEATKILRSKLATAGMPIVLLTARKDKESELAGLDAGADDYLTKPFDKDKLLARVKMLLRRTLNKERRNG